MLVALGFFAATLLALLILPLVSHRAARRAMRDLAATLPLTLEEIAAERDGLRAQSAVEQRRTEQQLERAQAATAEAESELGRRTAELIGAERAREAVQSERAALAEDLGKVRDTLASVEARRDELERSAADLQARLAREEQEHRATAKQRDELDSLAEQRRAEVAALATRVSGLEALLSDRNEEIERNSQQQLRLRSQMNEAARDRDLARNEILLVNTQRAMLDDDLRGAMRRLEDEKARHRAKTEALLTAERQLIEEVAQRKATEAALADLRRRFDQLEARLIEAGGQAAQTLVESDLDKLRVSISDVADAALDTLSDRRAPRINGNAEPTKAAALP